MLVDVAEHIGLAKHIASRVCRKFRFHDFDLVASAAYEALVYSASRFDSSKGKFSTFAGNMIEWQCAIEIKAYRKREMSRLYRFGSDGEERSLEPVARKGREVDLVAMLEAISALKPNYRSLIEKVLDGQSLPCIARASGISPQAIWEQYKRALNQLKSALEKAGKVSLEDCDAVL